MNVTPQNRQQILTVVALAAVALWLGDRLLFTPLAKSWQDRSARIVELRKSIAQGKQLLANERTFRSRWEGMRTNTLPAEVSAAEERMVKPFYDWVQQSRVSITSIKPQWKRTAEEYATLECQVDVTGSLSALAKFLYSVEKDPLGLKIESLQLTSKNDDGSQLSLGLLVTGLQLNSTEP
ncbi:MAG TPA: type 4a pilus biogenesis protein PilO [Verrucomicrobiae bacterium]|nr:type 4a pilus biogenesis protein PilO [Verrucomicrobiae bacterium]